MKSSSPSRWLLVAGGLVVCGVVAVVGFVGWRSHVFQKQRERSFHAAERLLDESRAADALAIIRSNKEVGERAAKGGPDWWSLEVAARQQLRDIPGLLSLYDSRPRAFAGNETASLLAARGFFHMRNQKAFSALCEQWATNGTQKAAWFALEVDALLSAGKREEALARLRSRSFDGADDCGRLARLALLTAKDDLHGAWLLLDRAYEKDSRNADIRSFRAQILERIGKPAEARVEYVAAHLADPTNPLLRDQLAEFYRRRDNYRLALETWKGSFTKPTPGFIWLKALFWSRVARPVDHDWTKAAPSGRLGPLVRHLLALEPGEFWKDEAFAGLGRGHEYLARRQETFWLRVLAYLKVGQEEEASKLLRTNPFRARSWHPALEDALQCVLNHRRLGLLNPGDAPFSFAVSGEEARHQFFDQLAQCCRDQSLGVGKQIPSDLDWLLRSRAAFAACFLAAGWLEAALSLWDRDADCSRFPDWVAYGITQALRLNRGSTEALRFARRWQPTPALKLLIGELLVADGQTDQGVAAIAALATDDSSVGFRAAWLLSLANVERGQFDEARQVVGAQPRLVNSTTGKEVLARISVIEGKTAEAERQYAAIRNDSIEARAYLARRAFANRDWSQARQLTRELMHLMPDQMQLRENLRAIDEAESG